MAKLIALCKKHAAAAAFDAYYFATHVPIAKKIAGLRRYEVSETAADLANFAQAGVALLIFDSKEV